MTEAEQWVRKAGALGASDLHLVCGLPPRARVQGELRDLASSRLSHDDCESLGRELAGTDFAKVEKQGAADLSLMLAGIRCRVQVFRQQGHSSAAVRLLREQIPSPEELGLPPSAMMLTEARNGLILVTGETGSGKSTTLAAMIDRINRTARKHILTLEDPIEYIYTPDLATVNQREVGRDTASFESGLTEALREDPDVLLIGEIRSPEAIATALAAAETGHLVLTTLHTNTAADAVDRIVQSFSGSRQPQIRLQLSMTLRGILCQQLLPSADGSGRVLAAEVMIPTHAIRHLIREGKTPQMENAQLSSAAEGGTTMDAELLRLVRGGRLRAETALRAAHDPDYLQRLLNPRIQL